MNEAEWQTRKKRIDTRLRAMSPAWQIIRHRDSLDFSKLHCHAVEELPTENGPADYGLFVNGQLLGIIEAKKVTVNPQNVLEQAKRYAAGAFQGPGNWDGLKVPFLYATNGEIIWYLDLAQKSASPGASAIFTRRLHLKPTLRSTPDPPSAGCWTSRRTRSFAFAIIRSSASWRRECRHWRQA